MYLLNLWGINFWSCDLLIFYFPTQFGINFVNFDFIESQTFLLNYVLSSSCQLSDRDILGLLWLILTVIQQSPANWKKGRVLGSGGFGQVYLWYDSDTGCEMAVKQVHIYCPSVEVSKVTGLCALGCEVDVFSRATNCEDLQLLEFCRDAGTCPTVHPCLYLGARYAPLHLHLTLIGRGIFVPVAYTILWGDRNGHTGYANW